MFNKSSKYFVLLKEVYCRIMIWINQLKVLTKVSDIVNGLANGSGRMENFVIKLMSEIFKGSKNT